MKKGSETTDLDMLLEGILRFLGLDLQRLHNSSSFWLVDTEDEDWVICFDGKQREVTVVDGGLGAGDILGLLFKTKTFSHSLDPATCKPKKIAENPFYGSKSFEAAAIKLDLLRVPGDAQMAGLLADATSTTSCQPPFCAALVSDLSLLA